MLHLDVNKLQDATLSKSSRKTLIRHILAYFTFCAYFGFNPLPATPYILAGFATHLSKRLKSVRTIAGYICNVIRLHKMCGFMVPNRKNYQFKATMNGLKRKLKRRIKKALPITPEILLKIRQTMDLSDPLDATYWALFVVCFFILVRASNVTPKSYKKFNARKQLTRNDIFVGRRSALVKIKWTKTLQCGESVFTLPMVRIKGSPLCPVWALKNMCKLNPAKGSGPAFCHPDGTAVSYWQFLNKLKSTINSIGLDGRLYSVHSFRRGGCTALFNANIRSSVIKLVGTWASECYTEYITWPLEQRVNAACSFSRHIGNFK